jgi:hypothetical protein
LDIYFMEATFAARQTEMSVFELRSGILLLNRAASR